MGSLQPTRYLRLRHPDGFSPEMFDRFRSGCALWDAYVQVALREWSRLGGRDGAPTYTCLPPELSPDRRVASLPIAGQSTLGSRVKYENCASYLLREFLPFDFLPQLEEGLTEDMGGGRGMQTNWRRPADVIQRLAGQVAPFPSGTST
jgi:hypothetical protein